MTKFSKLSKIFSPPQKSTKSSKPLVKNDVPKRSSNPKHTSQTGLESRPRPAASTAKTPPASTATAPRAPVPPPRTPASTAAAPRAPVQAPHAPATTAAAPRAPVSAPRAPATTAVAPPSFVSRTGNAFSGLTTKFSDTLSSPAIAPSLNMLSNITKNVFQEHVVAPVLSKIGNDTVDRLQNYVTAPPQTRQQPYEQDFSTAYAQNALAAGLDRFEDNTPWQQAPAQDFRTPDSMRMMYQSDVPDMGNFAANMPQNYPMAPPQTRQQPYEQDLSTAYAQNASAAGLDRFEDNAPWQQAPAQDFRTPDSMRMMHQSDVPDMENFAANIPQNYAMAPPQTRQQPYEQDLSTAYAQNASAAGLDRFEDNALWQQAPAQDFRTPDSMRMMHQSDVPDMENFAANMQQNYAMAPPQTRQQPYEQDLSTAYAQNASATGLDRFEANTPWQQPPAQDFRALNNTRMMNKFDAPDLDALPEEG